MRDVKHVPETLPTSFDRLTAMVCAVLDVPYGLVSILEDDLAVFRSQIGLGQHSTPRELSVSERLVRMGPGATLVITDALQDPDLRQHPLVVGEPHLRFLAGVTICDGSGKPIGAIAAMDVVPRAAPTPSQMEILIQIARIAGDQFDHAQARRIKRERLELLTMAEEMSGLGHWRFDLMTGVVEWSTEVYRIHGRDPQTFDPSYSDVLADYHPDDRDGLAACVERAIATGEGYNLELRLVRQSGEVRRVITRARTKTDKTGRPVVLFGVFQDMTDQVKKQEEVEASEARYRLLAETATDIVARFDSKGRFSYISPSVRTVLGRDPETMLGKDCSAFVCERELARIRSILKDYVRAGPDAPSPRYEYQAMTADGRTVWLEATPRAIRDAKGDLVEFHDCVRDVTARKDAERAQAELVETLGMTEELAGVGCWRLDVASGHVTWSDEVYRIHGKDRATFDPSLDDAVACYHPDDRQAVADWCERAIATGEADEFSLRIVREDGEERIVNSQCRPERDAAGATTALFGVFQDVTERVRGRARIEASEARYRLLADRASDIIVTYGVDGLIQYISPSVEAATGIAPVDLIGRAVTHLILDEDVPALAARFREMVRAAPGTIQPGVVYRASVASGEVRWMEARTTLVRDGDGRVVQFHDVVRDITETKRLEDALIEARDVAEAGARAKSEFLANMSHELRTPLTSVIGFSGLLQASQALPEAERRYADRIATSSEALLSVINDILDYSKLEAEAVDLDPVAFDPVAMAQAAASIVETQCEAKGLTLAVTMSSALPEAIMGDEGRLRQVTLNFLSNAMKFTASGEIRLDVAVAGERMRVAVTDSGIGIAPEKIDALFERFTQADASTTRVYGGTGLGLAICRRLIEMMGGEIGATSRPGRGSTFWFEVPLVVAEPLDVMPDDELDALPDGLKVLMADDAAANRELVRVLLEAWGVELTTVCDGAEAVQVAANGNYDLILMDVHMPVMDGLDACLAIRALGGDAAETPILALTANVQPEQVEACRAAGMDGHVGKPIEISALVQAMTRALQPQAPTAGKVVA